MLQREAETTDLHSILNRVCRKVAYGFQSNVPGDHIMHEKKQIPCVTSMLTRDLVFTRKSLLPRGSPFGDPGPQQERLPTHYTPPQILTNSTAPLEVRVKVGQDLPKTLANNCYRMEAKPRGFVLIIDNENFQGDVLPTRTGSVVDANNLDILFGQLGFRVTLRRNLGYYDMIQEVQRFAGRSEHAAADMAVLAVLSHGRHGLVAAADGRELEVRLYLILVQLTSLIGGVDPETVE